MAGTTKKRRTPHSTATARHISWDNWRFSIVALFVNVGDRPLPLDVSISGGWKVSDCRAVDEAYDGQDGPLPLRIGAYTTLLVRFVK